MPKSTPFSPRACCTALAFTELKFSNSVIEAWRRSLKPAGRTSRRAEPCPTSGSLPYCSLDPPQ